MDELHVNAGFGILICLKVIVCVYYLRCLTIVEAAKP